MAESTIYSNLSFEELEKKRKSLLNWKIIFVSIAVFSVLITLYAVYRDNIGKHTFLILGSLFLIINNGSKLKKVESEIEKRKN
jgi:hypothetical protein